MLAYIQIPARSVPLRLETDVPKRRATNRIDFHWAIIRFAYVIYWCDVSVLLCVFVPIKNAIHALNGWRATVACTSEQCINLFTIDFNGNWISGKHAKVCCCCCFKEFEVNSKSKAEPTMDRIELADVTQYNQKRQQKDQKATTVGFVRNIPAILRSRILRQSASAFRIGQFSILVEKLRKKRYSFNVTDIRRAIFAGRLNWHFELFLRTPANVIYSV